MSLPVQAESWRDNSATHNSSRVTRTCECGNSYTTPEMNPYMICPECQDNLVKAFWATME